MITYWIYDSAANKAVQMNVDFGQMEDDFHNLTETDTFRVSEFDDYVGITNPTSEYLELKNTSPEQIVILFATMLGLREAAKE